MWFTASSVTATNNSNVVKINSNASIANIKPGDALIIGSFNPVEILKAYASDQGSFIQLAEPWTNATQSQVPALVLPTRSALNEAITAINGANKLVNDNYQAILDWQTKTGEVTFKDLNNVSFTVKTMKEIQSDIEFSNPYPHAMTEVEYETLKEARKNKYKTSGFIESGYGHTSMNVARGLWCLPSEESRILLGASGVGSSWDGIGESKTKHPIVVMDGVQFDILYTNYSGPTPNVINLPPPLDGTKTFDSASGSVTEHPDANTAFLSETATNKVILSCQDAVILVKRTHIITETNIVYPLSNANYGRDEYLGLNIIAGEKGGYHIWSSLNQSLKDKYCADPRNNIRRTPSGDLKQDFYEFVVISGPANDWIGGSSLRGGTGGLPWKSRYFGFPRVNSGQWLFVDSRDFKFTLTYHANYSLLSQSEYSDNPNVTNDLGVFSTMDRSVFVMPIAIIQRHNKCGFEPELNPYGTAKLARANIGSSVINNHIYFYDSFESGIRPLSSRDCCIPKNNAEGISAGYHSQTGLIGQPSGRLDSYQSANAVYVGQVEDHRILLKQSDDHFIKAQTGKMRGKQGLSYLHTKHQGNLVRCVKTSSAINNEPNYSSVQFSCDINDPTRFFNDLNCSHWLIVGDNGEVMKIKRQNQFHGYIYVGYNSSVYLYGSGNVADELNSKFPNGTQLTFMAQSELNSSYDLLPCVDLLGDLLDLAEVFPNGIVGNWVESKYNGEKSSYEYNNKYLSAGQMVISDDLGGTWALGTQSIWFSSDVTNSSESVTFPIGRIAMAFYETKSKISLASELLKILHIGDVFSSGWYSMSRGARLQHSLTGSVGKNSSTTKGVNVCLPLKNKASVNETSIFDIASWGSPVHDPIPFMRPTYDSPIFKALLSVVEKDGLKYLQFNGSELVFDTPEKIDISLSNKTTDAKVGKVYRVSGDVGSILAGKSWYCVTATSADFDSNIWVENANGEVLAGESGNDANVYFVRYYHDGFGDDHKVPMLNNENTKTDLNGNKVKVFCHRSIFPIGIA